MPRVTKQETLDLLAGLRATVLYGFVLLHDAQNDEIANRIDGETFGFEANRKVVHSLDLSMLAGFLRNPSDRHTIRSNFAIILKHTLVHRTHEFVCAYCEASNQFEKYKSQPWFQFARIVRNILAHGDGNTLSEWPGDLTKRRIDFVEWRDLRIEASQVRDDASGRDGLVTLEPAHMIQLHENIAEFLRSID